MSTEETEDECLAEVVDEILQSLRRGDEIDWPAWMARHSRHAEQLQRLAPLMALLVKCLMERRSSGIEATN